MYKELAEEHTVGDWLCYCSPEDAVKTIDRITKSKAANELFNEWSIEELARKAEEVADEIYKNSEHPISVKNWIDFGWSIVIIILGIIFLLAISWYSFFISNNYY